jgi:hypothetical protein
MNKIKILKGIEKACVAVGLAGVITLTSAGLIKKSSELLKGGAITGLYMGAMAQYTGYKVKEYEKYSEENQGQINSH